ncbi:MAG: hypothetical protein AB8B97_03265 [Granulosicoccus sp.]
MTCQDSGTRQGTQVLSSGLLAGMQPAFKHALTGEAHLAQIVKGIPSTVYGFEGLPDEWIVERDSSGNAIALHPDVMPGYWRDARFIALNQLTCMPLDG